MDAQTLRRTLHDMFRFNPKDFIVRGSATGFLIELVGKVASGGGNSLPYQAFKGKNSDDPTGSSAGYIYISKNSSLLKTVDPTDTIDIQTDDDDYNGLGKDESFLVVKADRVWLELDLTPLYDDPPKDIKASIGHGQTWQDSGKTFYPNPVEYDTDDGTRTGSDDDAPPDAKPITAFILIGYVDSSAIDTEGLIDAGFGLPIGPDPDSPGDSLYFLQKCFTHLIMGTICLDNGNPPFALPSPYGGMPDNS